MLSFGTSILGGALGVVPVDSGAPRILMDGAHGVDADKAYWSANGKDLVFHGHDARGRAAVFSAEERQSDVWVMELERP